ncbi:uncharacterized protein LOC119120987 isoform X2 [Syngnathus acus]|uniref:uncharacterized protein LOC119120987 isoform X2 n=1 Tax=Syngnathus acus TaxID=161584 RepID=UPI0018862B1F|nr:uncharacterized protein LOC119120987 isoform X2 [Syngnathus acus]
MSSPSDSGDENSSDCIKRLSPQNAEALVVQTKASSLSSSTATFRESPNILLDSGAFWRRNRSCDDQHDCASSANCEAPQVTAMVFPFKRDTPVCKQGTSCVVPKSLSVRKRTLDEHGAHPQLYILNELFSLKCMDLQCYIQPLSSILRGLKSGRYSTRFSSFQERVAMDRIQRIMGVLQNPNMGGHFLSIIMKIEEMLQIWFPRIKPNQVHYSPPSKKQKVHSSAPSSPASVCSSDGSWVTCNSCNQVGRLHISPICSLERLESTVGPRSLSQGVTQDNFVSSSTDCRLLPPHRLRGPPCCLSQATLPLNMSSPCLERLLKAKKSNLTSRRDSKEADCHGYWHDSRHVRCRSLTSQKS